MSGSIQATSCANHPDQSAVGSCGNCGKPVCDACRVEDVAIEATFCSERCRESRPGKPGGRPVDNATLEAGLRRPIRTGWALALRSTGRIVAHVLPIVIVGGLTVAWLNRMAEGPAGPLAPAIGFGFVLLVLFAGAFGVALVGVILSARHTGCVHGPPYALVARRFLPWLATWVLMIAIAFAGYLLLIFPGIYLSLRLFWADEFALVHDRNPIAALRASWELTRKQAGEIFIFQFLLGFAQYLILIPAVLVLAVLIGGLDAISPPSDPDTIGGLHAVVLLFVGFVAYGAMHGPEIVKFYGMRAARANVEAGLAPAAGTRTRGGLVVVAVLGGVFIFAIIASIAIPNLLNAIDRGKQKRTFADSRIVAIGIERFFEVQEQYPEVTSIEELERLLVPDYLEALPMVDGWERPFRVVSKTSGYEIRSAGKDGVFETNPPRGPTTTFDDDIVWQDGELVQWPESLEPE
jgi:hypothetical protein